MMTARHFPYQHPTFGTKSNLAKSSRITRSIYFWWWEFLRRHAEYRQTCEANGEGALSALYADFGDIHATDFRTWWNQRGVDLFAEPPAVRSVVIVRPGEQSVNIGDPALLIIAFPLSLPKRYLRQRFSALLKRHHTRRRGQQTAKESRAKYKVHSSPNFEALRRTLAVFDLRVSNPQMPLWEIAVHAKVVGAAQAPKQSDSPGAVRDKRRICTVTASRYLRHAKLLIENVGIGIFPKNRR